VNCKGSGWWLGSGTEFFWISLDFPGFSWIFLDFPGFLWGFLVFSGGFWFSLGFSGFVQIVQIAQI
jgi:hypothetical protein